MTVKDISRYGLFYNIKAQRYELCADDATIRHKLTVHLERKFAMSQAEVFSRYDEYQRHLKLVYDATASSPQD